MTKRMLIDATHAEETRVVVLDGNRLEDFDVETSTKKQLKGNIYLAKVVRVEPSLQAAFVEYGGGRHGFLAFGEIHPDYYQIPVADRQRLLALQAEEAREEEEAEEAAERALQAAHARHAPPNRQPVPGPADDQPALPPFAEPVPVPHDPHTDDSAEPDAAEPDAAEPGAAAAAPDHVAGDARAAASGGASDGPAPDEPPYEASIEPDHVPSAALTAPGEPWTESAPAGSGGAPDAATDGDAPEPRRPARAMAIAGDMRFGAAEIGDERHPVHVPGGAAAAETGMATESGDHDGGFGSDVSDFDIPVTDLPPPETIGGETDSDDGAAELRARRASRLLRNYRIQEVIRRRQIMLVQVVKEERGTKGAALTTYISLAGRFCVLMPNSPRGGGISRKITSAADRRRLKEITTELEIPRGMGLIVRTAGANRPKPEIRRDCEYLMRLWDDIREHTMRSVAPALIYEEASLIKRAIRDVYSRDVEEILVDGEQGWRAAHEFMRMLMPSHAKKVQLWRPNVNGGGGQPLFARQNVEAQLDAMMSPTVQLRSGGYLVIAQTEALVSIDVNSGRSTRERGIEETALKTNLEAADEVARQLRLRDLAGLIVIDFIDMEAKRNNAAVERRIKEALKNDRARIQVGHISHFGLLEMSRQRLRPSLAESSFVQCPHCGGAGLVRGVESSAIHVLRDIEEEGAKQRASLIMVHCAPAITMYLLNNKRGRLAEIEQRFAMTVHFNPDESLVAPQVRIDRLRPQIPEAERPAALASPGFVPGVPPAAATFANGEAGRVAEEDDEEEADGVYEDDDVKPVAVAPPRQAGPGAVAPAAARAAEGEGDRPRRRRRRRRGNRRDVPRGEGADFAAAPGDGVASDGSFGGDDDDDEAEEGVAAGAADAPVPRQGDAPPAPDDAPPAVVLGDDGQPLIDHTAFDENGLPVSRGPRRNRRGGRRRRRDELPEGAEAPDIAANPVAVAPSTYDGPTPANPFGGQVFDIFDLMDQEPDPAPDPAAPRPPVHEPAPAIVAREPDSSGEPVPPIGEPPAAIPPADEPPAGEAPVHEPPPPDEPAPEAPHDAPPAGDPPPAASVAAIATAMPEPPAPDVAVPDPAPPENVIKPIVIGADDAPVAAPKKGWWRR